MAFKINMSVKSGKTFHIELDSDELMGKELHDKISGKDVSPDFEGYEFEITGTSDKAGFTSLKEVEGIGLKRVLLSYEKGMKKRPKKEGKKKRSKNKPKGLRLRKTVRGRVISSDIVQINLNVLKEGNKKLADIFPDQNKVAGDEVKPEIKPEAKSEKPVEVPKEEPKEKPKEEPKEEKKKMLEKNDSEVKEEKKE